MVFDHPGMHQSLVHRNIDIENKFDFTRKNFSHKFQVTNILNRVFSLGGPPVAKIWSISPIQHSSPFSDQSLSPSTRHQKFREETLPCSIMQFWKNVTFFSKQKFPILQGSFLQNSYPNTFCQIQDLTIYVYFQ